MDSSSSLCLRERREAIVREHIAAENVHDPFSDQGMSSRPLAAQL